MLAGCDRLLIAGSGIDYVSARELALKVEEGARLPAVAHQLETVRHGHLAAANDRTGLILVLTDGEARGGPLLERARAVARSALALGMPAAALLAADLGDDVPMELTPAGRLPIPVATRLPRLISSTLASAIPLQLLAERLARARGRNPDTIGRDDPRQAAAADA
jgi:glucosamine--fructose-6-phosphate aminotransferase (isomerizing)